jgi:hypothetical protein
MRNQAVRNSGAARWDPARRMRKVSPSKTEDSGPMTPAYRTMPRMFQRCGRARSAVSIVSNGMPISERSYRRLLRRICVASRGRNGRKSEAAAIDSMLPKFELDPMRTYLRTFAKVRRPSSTPSATTLRSAASRIISAAARAAGGAIDGQADVGDRMPGASLTPSPRNPTVSPLA